MENGFMGLLKGTLDNRSHLVARSLSSKYTFVNISLISSSEAWRKELTAKFISSRKYARALDLKPPTYRKMLTKLRKYLKVVEISMSKGDL